MEEADASFNNEAAEYHLRMCGSGGRRPFLAGLGGEGESVRPSEKGVVDKLLAGRGGEEERTCAAASSSASSRRSYLLMIRVVVAGHRLGFSLTCRGGEEGEAADSPPNAYRSQRLPKRCCGAASSSPLLLLMKWGGLMSAMPCPCIIWPIGGPSPGDLTSQRPRNPMGRATASATTPDQAFRPRRWRSFSGGATQRRFSSAVQSKDLIAFFKSF
jgi:hypothetical protein